MKNKEDVYSFLAGFKQDSAFFINNFLRKHTPEQYKKGEFNSFDFVTGGIDDWGNPKLTYQILAYMSRAKEYIHYWPIQPGYMQRVMSFATYMSEQPPLNNPMIVYRGCNDLEIDGVNGLVSTSTDKKIAEQFNRGTLLKIHLPKGMKIVRVDKLNPNKKSQDIEHEVILPPCDYTIKSEKEINLKGPNNHSGKTKVVEIDVQPRDLLRELSLVMDNPIQDYMDESLSIGNKEDYRTAFMHLLVMLEKRAITNCHPGQKVRGTGLYGGTDVLKRRKMDCKNKTNMYRAFSLMNSNQPLPNHIIQSMREKAINQFDLPNQITTKQFFDYIKKSKAKHIFYGYENTEDHKSLYQCDYHGIRHADNVTMFTYYIASKEGHSDDAIRILMEAARYHDIGRTNAWQEGGHGFAGAKKYAEEFKGQIPISEQQIVGFLINAHDAFNQDAIRMMANKMFGKYCSEEDIDKICDMANIIRDADALDRTRFPIYSLDYLNSKLLTHHSARELIEVAQTINYRENMQSKEQMTDKRKDKKTVVGENKETR